MRTLIAFVALATAIASPAFAGSTRTHAKHQTISPYGQYVPARVRQPVYGSRQYVGTDPDIYIRPRRQGFVGWY